MDAYPFTVHGGASLERLQAALGSRIADWLEQWFGDREASITVRNVAGLDDPLKRQLAAAAPDSLALGSRDDDFLALPEVNGDGMRMLRGIMGTNEEPAFSAGASLAALLERGVAIRALHALFDRLSPDSREPHALRVAPLAEGSPEPTRIFRSGSGWVVVEVDRAGAVLMVLLGPGLLDPLLPVRSTPRRGDLPRARVALAAQRVTLRADLGVTTLTVGQVNGLGVGDVVTLEQHFDAPVSVGIQGRELVQGRFGARGGYRAVRLCPA